MGGLMAFLQLIFMKLFRPARRVGFSHLVWPHTASKTKPFHKEILSEPFSRQKQRLIFWFRNLLQSPQLQWGHRGVVFYHSMPKLCRNFGELGLWPEQWSSARRVAVSTSPGCAVTRGPVTFAGWGDISSVTAPSRTQTGPGTPRPLRQGALEVSDSLSTDSESNTITPWPKIKRRRGKRTRSPTTANTQRPPSQPPNPAITCHQIHTKKQQIQSNTTPNTQLTDRPYPPLCPPKQLPHQFTSRSCGRRRTSRSTKKHQ